MIWFLILFVLLSAKTKKDFRRGVKQKEQSNPRRALCKVRTAFKILCRQIFDYKNLPK